MHLIKTTFVDKGRMNELNYVANLALHAGIYVENRLESFQNVRREFRLF